MSSTKVAQNIKKCILLAVLMMPLIPLVANQLTVHAQGRIESDNYLIIFPNLNSGAGIPNSTNYTLNSTVGQATQGEISSTNYTVKAGFQYLHAIIPFFFSISDISVNFGTLTPQTAATQTSTIAISAGGAGGYTLKAIESDNLKNDNDVDIPDTSCDSSCTISTAGVWTTNTTYGFGYNMSGDDVPADFTTTDYYRPFANTSSADNPTTIMSKSGVTYDYPSNTWPWKSDSTIKYKANISNVQASGNYSTVITYIATPSF